MEAVMEMPEVQCKGMLNSISDAMCVIGGKWKIRVIVARKDGCTRFNEIQRALGGISARVLSNELKELELNGFVIRTVQTKTPVIVEYRITEYADTLGGVLQALADWGSMHRDKIRKEM